MNAQLKKHLQALSLKEAQEVFEQACLHTCSRSFMRKSRGRRNCVCYQHSLMHCFSSFLLMLKNYMLRQTSNTPTHVFTQNNVCMTAELKTSQRIWYYPFVVLEKSYKHLISGPVLSVLSKGNTTISTVRHKLSTISMTKQEWVNLLKFTTNQGRKITQGFVAPPSAGRDAAYQIRKRITVISGEKLCSHHSIMICSKDQKKLKNYCQILLEGLRNN